jgi:mannosyltransferase OCH1-like enzyme
MGKREKKTRVVDMKVKDKEHQFLGLKELNQLVMEYPNDAALGKYIRQMYWKQREIHTNCGTPECCNTCEPDWIDANPF